MHLSRRPIRRRLQRVSGSLTESKMGPTYSQNADHNKSVANLHQFRPNGCPGPLPVDVWSPGRLTVLMVRREMAILILLMIVGIGRASTSSAIDRLQPLVETTARRLAIAEQIALSKWDTQLPVEDPLREERVIVNVTKEGQSRGLDRSLVSGFFRAQIEANKLVQYSLLGQWRRVGTAPDHAPIKSGREDPSRVGCFGHGVDRPIGRNDNHPRERVMSRRHRKSDRKIYNGSRDQAAYGDSTGSGPSRHLSMSTSHVIDSLDKVRSTVSTDILSFQI
jgi:chorismate mutase-like protein